MNSIEQQNIENARARLERQWQHTRPHRWHEQLRLWLCTAAFWALAAPVGLWVILEERRALREYRRARR